MNRFIKLGGLLGLGLACLMGLHFKYALASSEDDRQNYIIDAFLHSPLIQPVLEDYDRRGLLRGKPQTMMHSGTCGFAGCGYSALVGQYFFYPPGVNPQSFSVLALVYVDTRGRVDVVERVGLLPWEMIPSASETLPPLPPLVVATPSTTTPAPPIKIKVSKTLPATPPNFEIIKNLPAPMTTPNIVLP